MSLEIERKYILKRLPYFTPDQVLSIMQFYTSAGSRYRSSTNMETKNTFFYKTDKTPVSDGVNEEIESEIHQLEFYYNMQHAVKALHKVRHVFRWVGYKFELDVFSHHKELVLMEVELKSMDEEFEIPTFLQELILEEVTGQKEYNNFQIAVPIPTKS